MKLSELTSSASRMMAQDAEINVAGTQKPQMNGNE